MLKCPSIDGYKNGYDNDENSWNSDVADFSDEDTASGLDSKKVTVEDPVKAMKKERRKLRALEILKQTTTIKETNIFQATFEQLQELELESGEKELYLKFKALVKNNGLEKTDPRISSILEEVADLERRGEDFTFETFTAELHGSFTLVRKLINSQFIYNDYRACYKAAKDIYDRVNELDIPGIIPDYIPELKSIKNENEFAVSICTVDGQVINLGNTKNRVTMHALSSVVSYLIALEQYGEDELKNFIGSEASGNQFNSLELMESGLPHNPLNNAGALMSSSLIFKNHTTAKKYENYQNVVKKLIGGRKVNFNNEMYLCEMDNAHANYSLLYMLEEEGTLPEGTDIKNTLKFYTQACALDLTVSDYALLAASLANGGICPLTEERCVADSNAVKLLLSQMLASGMNTNSGKWAFDIGLPTKSAVSGLSMMVVPNTCGVCVWSPKLNSAFNSAKGEVFLQEFARKFGYNDTDHQYGAGKMSSILMRKHMDEKINHIHLLYQAKEGNLKEIRRSVTIGRKINYKDYDDRTALHLAAGEGHLKVVKYLLAHGAKVNVEDRFGHTPYDDALANGHHEIVELLSKAN